MLVIKALSGAASNIWANNSSLPLQQISEVISTPGKITYIAYFLKQEINFGWPTNNMPTAEHALGFLLIIPLEGKQQ